MEYNPYQGSNAEHYAGGSNTFVSISGVVLKKGVPYRATVHLFNPLNNQVVATQSNDMGAYTFKGLPKGHRFTVFARDIAQVFNAVIQDNVVPK